MWREVRNLLPRESIAYFGDGLNCPYGDRPKEEIVELTLNGVQFLVDGGAKLVVVACNTATAAAIDAVRERFAGVPIVGMLPAVKPAAAATRTGKIAVLATESSLRSEGLAAYINEFARDVEVISAAGTGFVELVEQGGDARIVADVIEPLLKKGVDKIVLGCTHYPFLREEIERVIGGRDVEVIDPSAAVARRVGQLLAEGGLLSDGPARYEFHTLGGEDYLEKIKRIANDGK